MKIKLVGILVVILISLVGSTIISVIFPNASLIVHGLWGLVVGLNYLTIFSFIKNIKGD